MIAVPVIIIIFMTISFLQCELITANRPLKSSCCHLFSLEGWKLLRRPVEENAFPTYQLAELGAELAFLSKRVIEKWQI